MRCEMQALQNHIKELRTKSAFFSGSKPFRFGAKLLETNEPEQQVLPSRAVSDFLEYVAEL